MRSPGGRTAGQQDVDAEERTALPVGVKVIQLNLVRAVQYSSTRTFLLIVPGMYAWSHI